jgi:hypothetical protein
MPMIARGLTNKEIASHLNLSEQTVKNHIHRLLRRVGANDRLDVAEMAGVQESGELTLVVPPERHTCRQSTPGFRHPTGYRYQGLAGFSEYLASQGTPFQPYLAFFSEPVLLR